MRCVFFSGGECYFGTDERGTILSSYKPSKNEKSKFCESSNFANCPRYKYAVLVLEKVGDKQLKDIW